MKINYSQTDNEPQAAMVRMVAAGGRAMEGQGAGPSGTGVVSIGTRTLSESGTVGGWRRDQVQPCNKMDATPHVQNQCPDAQV